MMRSPGINGKDGFMGNEEEVAQPLCFDWIKVFRWGERRVLKCVVLNVLVQLFLLRQWKMTTSYD
jgi:hypothetical protein